MSQDKELTVLSILERIRGLEAKKKAHQQSCDAKIKTLKAELERILDQTFGEQK